MSIKDKILDAINSLLSFPNEVSKELKEDNEEQEQEQEETLLSNTITIFQTRDILQRPSQNLNQRNF